MVSQTGTPLVTEISSLLDQCSSGELDGILAAIDDGLSAPAVEGTNASAVASMGPLLAPPPGPPPSGRRPCPPRSRTAQAATAPLSKSCDTAGPSEFDLEDPSAQTFTAEEVRQMLREHSAALLAEVRRFVPDAPTAAPTALLAPCEDGIGAAALNKALKDRESEAVVLGARLKELRAALTAKDKRMESSSADLDATIREVRHRQLDLEFQQLKLEERVRANSELENSQRQLTAHVEEASLTARHAAIDIDACRTFPRAVRVQGSLPWTLRKSKV